MSVRAAYVYREGKRNREIDVTQAFTIDGAGNEFAWIGLVDPTGDELSALRRRFNLHPLAVEDALKARQRPKVEVYGDQLFVVARTAFLENERIAYGETAMFVGPDFIITAHHGSDRDHSNLRQRLEAVPASLAQGVDYVLHAVLDFIVDGYFPIVEAIEEEMLKMERHALDAFLTRKEVRRIFNVRRELMRFRRILGPMEEVASRLEHHAMPCIDPGAQLYFRDVRDHIRRVAAMVEGLRDVVASVFEVSTLLEQQRQGAITRQLAAWAAILAVPTAIAGIYGMNFKYMPELDWKYGYFIVLGVIAALCGYLYFRFRRARWL